jgi:hypothetical protein
MNIGRNDPCPCGSGLKYKKCCLLKLEDMKRVEELEWQEWFKKDCEQGAANLEAYEAELAKKGVCLPK